MIDIGKMIVALRKERGWTQEELAKRCTCSKQVISLYEHNRRQPSYDMLELLADTFNVPMGFFLGPDEQRERLIETHRREGVLPANFMPVETITYIPVMGTVRCGPGGVALQDIDGYLPAVNVKNPSECFYLRVTGDSMTPRIQPGDLALIRKTSDVESGQLAAVCVRDEDTDEWEGMVKKLIRRGDTIILQSFNPDYPPRIFSGAEMANIVIQGKVIQTTAQWE